MDTTRFTEAEALAAGYSETEFRLAARGRGYATGHDLGAQRAMTRENERAAADEAASARDRSRRRRGNSEFGMSSGRGGND
jgi:hypothetical protein